MKYIIVFVLGIVVGTIGVGGLFHVMDHGVSKVQNVAKDLAQ